MINYSYKSGFISSENLIPFSEMMMSLIYLYFFSSVEFKNIFCFHLLHFITARQRMDVRALSKKRL